MKPVTAFITLILLATLTGMFAAPAHAAPPAQDATPTVTPIPSPTPGYELDNTITWGDISTVGLLCAGGIVFLVLGTVAVLFSFLQWGTRRRAG